VLAYYGVEYLDLSDKFYVPTAPNGSKLFLDGLHPNAAGHQVLADSLIAYLKNKFL
jgi:lysophospholipase L1-like esterase